MVYIPQVEGKPENELMIDTVKGDVKENKISSFSILRTHYIKFKNCKSNKQTFSFVI